MREIFPLFNFDTPSALQNCELSEIINRIIFSVWLRMNYIWCIFSLPPFPKKPTITKYQVTKNRSLRCFGFVCFDCFDFSKVRLFHFLSSVFVSQPHCVFLKPIVILMTWNINSSMWIMTMRIEQWIFAKNYHLCFPYFEIHGMRLIVSNNCENSTCFPKVY